MPDRIREARQPPALRLRVVHRQAALFRQPAAQLAAAPDALAEAHPEVSSSARPRREVCRDGASVRRRREASSRALLPEERLSRGPRSAEPLSWAALPWVLRPALPAHAWCQPEAALCAAARLAVSSWGCLLRGAAAGWSLRPAEVSAWCAQAVPSSREAAAEGQDAGVAQPSAVPAEPVASAQLPVVAREEESAAAAVLQRAAAGA
ncbi:MAG: hypothetical protein ACRERC_22145, partial [Candidatus Binatia bacterium]